MRTTPLRPSRQWTTRTEKINAAARAVMREGGIAAVSVEVLADAAGCSRDTIYRRGRIIPQAIAAQPLDPAVFRDLTAGLTGRITDIVAKRMPADADARDLAYVRELVVAAILEQMMAER